MEIDRAYDPELEVLTLLHFGQQREAALTVAGEVSELRAQQVIEEDRNRRALIADAVGGLEARRRADQSGGSRRVLQRRTETILHVAQRRHVDVLALLGDGTRLADHGPRRSESAPFVERHRAQLASVIGLVNHVAVR